jgi:hypothetical protein
MTLPVDTPLGRLEIVEVYLYYDGPRLFVCHSPSQQLYLANWIQGGEEDTWLYVALSRPRFNQLRRGEISLHDAFTLAEDNFVYLLRLALDGSLRELKNVPSHDLPPEWLPLEGEHLELSVDDSLPEYGADAAAEIARNSRREILFMRLYDNVPMQHEAPAQRLGQLLVSLQGAVAAFGQALLGQTTARGVISGEILSGTELAVIGTYDGSFGVQLATVANVDMFGQSLVGDAIDELIALIDVGSDPEKLRLRLSSLRQRAASKYRALLTAVVAANTDVQVHWGSARADRGRSAKLPIEIAREALTAIQSIETSLAETLQVECTLIGLNIRTKFYEIRTRTDRKKYSGEIADEAMADVQHAVINDPYTAMLRLRIEANPITGEERFRWELTALKH